MQTGPQLDLLEREVGRLELIDAVVEVGLELGQLLEIEPAEHALEPIEPALGRARRARGRGRRSLGRGRGAGRAQQAGELTGRDPPGMHLGPDRRHVPLEIKLDVAREVAFAQPQIERQLVGLGRTLGRERRALELAARAAGPRPRPCR